MQWLKIYQSIRQIRCSKNNNMSITHKGNFFTKITRNCALRVTVIKNCAALGDVPSVENCMKIGRLGEKSLFPVENRSS